MPVASHREVRLPEIELQSHSKWLLSLMWNDYSGALGLCVPATDCLSSLPAAETQDSPISFLVSQGNKPPIVTPITLSPRDLLVSLGRLVAQACRFCSVPDTRPAHAHIRGRLCRGHYGFQAGRFVLLSGPGRSSIHTGRISRAFSWLF